MTRAPVLAGDRHGVIALGPVPKDQTVEPTRDKSQERDWALPGQAREMSYREFRGARSAGVPAKAAPTGTANGGPQ